MNHYVCIDIGGTAIKFGVLDETGEFLVKDKMDTAAYKGGPAIVEKACSIVKRYRGSFDLKGICISTAGMVDTEKGEIFYAAPLIPNYAGTQFKSVMEERFSLPCEVENDVNCAGLSESVSGAAKGYKVALCLTIGTGIGGAVIIDGKVFHGGSNSACEVGYMSVLDSDFQTLGASSILTKKVAAEKGEPPEQWNGYHIFEAAKEGDPICICAIDDMVDILGRGIANICYVLNPEVVVLGGGIMAQEQYLKGRITSALEKHLIAHIAKQTRIAFAKHQNDAGMLGAWYNFMQKQRT